MLIFDSMKKSRVMKKIVNLMESPITGFQDMMTRKDKEKELFDELFQIMLRMNGLKQVIQKHNATPEEIQKISGRISLIIGHYHGDYLPVSLVSFASTLDCLLENKDLIMNYGYDEVQQVVEMAVKRL